MGRSAGDVTVTRSRYDDEVRVYEGTGALARLRNVAPEPPPVTPDEVAAYKEHMLDNLPPAMRTTMENTIEDIPVADMHPLFRTIHLGTDGSMCVVIDDVEDKGGSRAIVYDADGTRLGGTLLPAALDVKVISVDRVVGVWRDFLGVESVRSYAIERAR